MELHDQPWSEGYVVDTSYTHGFYAELTPSRLQFVTLLRGVGASCDVADTFTYVELGCGNGLSTALLAAANPRGQFIGVDFNPTHIHRAKQLAAKGRVDNVTFLEHSFAELKDRDLPQADIIALHGVYSWINDENRSHIRDFVRRQLNPAGIVYLSYNSMPGQAQIAPLQRLLLEHAAAGAGSLEQKARGSIEFARGLAEAGGNYFRFNPRALERLKNFEKRDPSYLLHEYFNDSWSLFYHADVARELAEAKLSYVGSAHLIFNFDQLVLRPQLLEIVSQFGDRTLAETIKDFAINNSFRRDVFVRGATPMDDRERLRALGRTRFALARPRSRCELKAETPAGELSMQEAAHVPVLDALAAGPMTFDELLRTPGLEMRERDQVRQAVLVMCAIDNVAPALPVAGEKERRKSAARFNAFMLTKASSSGAARVLASPVLGSGVMVSQAEQLFLIARLKKLDPVDYASKKILAAGGTVMREGNPVSDKAEIAALLRKNEQEFFAERLPHLIQLGVVD